MCKRDRRDGEKESEKERERDSHILNRHLKRSAASIKLADFYRSWCACVDTKCVRLYVCMKRISVTRRRGV